MFSEQLQILSGIQLPLINKNQEIREKYARMDRNYFQEKADEAAREAARKAEQIARRERELARQAHLKRMKQAQIDRKLRQKREEEEALQRYIDEEENQVVMEAAPETPKVTKVKQQPTP